MIDVRRLQVLAAVARHGSFNRAAAELRLTPSAVSQQISALERTVGATVVERSTRGVELTEAGRLLVETAEAVTAELTRTEKDLDRLAHARTDRLTVATFTSGGQRLLPAALRRLAAERPGVEFTVLEQEPEDSLPQVRNGTADLALVYHFDGPPPVRPGDRSGLIWTPLMDDPMFIVLPATHPYAGRDTLRIADLAGERWVHGCLGMGDTLDPYAAMAGFQPRVACRGTDYVFAQSLVRAEVGISMIPQVALAADQGGLVAVPLTPPGPTRYVGAVTARRRRPDPLTEALLRSLRDTVAALPAPV
ncbi:LysR family transcriptional regulator [Actinoplanes sp. NBRC 103695]|uniref:LysR family transcriptional regulator n=1 Tax=Actinoplanes sp. NBRC 103695 TaxID=3032202 RepID=UPI0024A60809|nr:LysR family transcriptional regulator [Actinoplanes sp. NBRC 103695]GLY93040.1 LysR family transcriptional regulator [Actinoplanes sp. NBRC 103695]